LTQRHSSQHTRKRHLLTRQIADIQADIAANETEKNRLGLTGPALEAELHDARVAERNQEQISLQHNIIAAYQPEVARHRLNVEQLQFLVSEADGEIAKLTATGDELNERVLAGNAAVIAAISAGDAAVAARCQEDVNSAGQALAHIPAMIATAQSHKSVAEAQLPAAESELATASNYVANATAEASRIVNLAPGVPWDQPNPPAPRVWPSGLGLGGEMILRQLIADNQAYLTTPLTTKVGEEIRPPRDPKPRSWKVGKLGKR
jgi:chromosome segregation ATPase